MHCNIGLKRLSFSFGVFIILCFVFSFKCFMVEHVFAELICFSKINIKPLFFYFV